MEGRGDILLDLQFLTEGLGEVGGEVGVSVRDDFGGQPEPPVDVFQVEFRYSFTRYGC